MLERFHLAVAIVTVLGSTAFLLALMVMRAEERRETVGIIRLIGVSQRFVLLVVLAEGLLIAAAGAVFGVVVGARGRRGRQSLLPVALRHHAGVRPRHARDRAAVDRPRGAARDCRRPGRLVDAAAPRHRDAGPPMTAWGLAWRTLVHNPARALLAIGGVAVIGALLFDMLLLSRGLLVSFRDLLDTAGFDVRVVGERGLADSPRAARRRAVAGGRDRRAARRAARRADPHRQRDGDRRPGTMTRRRVTLIGSTESGAGRRVDIVKGSPLPADRRSRAEPVPLIVSTKLAELWPRARARRFACA